MSTVPSIFLSYASKDRERVAPLAKALEGHGWTVWWDRKIPPGKTFDEVIKEGLAKSSCVIVVWSEASVESRWVKTEASVALQRNKLVPVMIDQVEPPLEFMMIQAANLVDWRPDIDTEEFSQLVSAIRNLTRVPRVDTDTVEDDHPGEIQGELEDRADSATGKVPIPRRRLFRYVMAGAAAVTAALIIGMILRLWPPAPPREPGVYMTAAAKEGDTIRDMMVEVVHAEPGDSGKGGAPRLKKDVRGLCLTRDVEAGHRLEWGNLKLCK